MKKFAAIIASLLLCVGACFAADPCEGYWISYDETTNQATAAWKIWVADNGTLTGQIVKVPNQDDATKAKAGKSYKDFYNGVDTGTLTVVGTNWIWNCKKSADGVWKNGNIIDPGSASKYTCTVTFHKADGNKYKVDTLEMKGSIGPIGRSQYWKQATEAEVKSL